MLKSKKQESNLPNDAQTTMVEKHHPIDKKHLTVNPGDRILENQTLEEKSKQLAVDAPDITGDHIRVPTYFIVEYPNGEKKALHHVKDAKEISDVIRQGEFYTDAQSQAGKESAHFNLAPMILIFALCLLSLPILIGIF